MESRLDHCDLSLDHFSKINVIRMDINIKRIIFLVLEKVTVKAEKAFAP